MVDCGTGFWTRAEVKDVFYYLRVIHNPKDQMGIDRIINIPKRGIGAKGVESLIAWARRETDSAGYSAILLDDLMDIHMSSEDCHQVFHKLKMVMETMYSKSEGPSIDSMFLYKATDVF